MDKNDKVLNVTSEIGTLKSVLIHRPGKELENLVPDHLERLLFDDIPYLKLAQKEHDYFAQILKDKGVKVFYLKDLVTEAIESEEVRNNIIQEFLDEANIHDKKLRDCLEDYLSQLNNTELIDKMMAGIRKTEVPDYCSNMSLLNDGYPLITDPMPNLYFTRDPSAVIGHGVTLNHMKTEIRNRETLFAKYIFEHHPKFKDKDIPYWYSRDEKTSLEGGDILVLGNRNLAIGISERTDSESIMKVAENILYGDDSFDRVIALYIPRKRAFMHLDTVFTVIDRDKFIVHPEIEGTLTVYSITKSDNRDQKLNIVEENTKLEDILKKYLELEKVDLIRCAGGDPIDAPREQWNDGSNVLALAPGEIVVYDRNTITNKILKDKGIKIHEMESSELLKGRGGPRCMSMPLVREDL